MVEYTRHTGNMKRRLLLHPNVMFVDMLKEQTMSGALSAYIDSVRNIDGGHLTTRGLYGAMEVIWTPKGKLCLQPDELEHIICDNCTKIACEICSDNIKNAESLPYVHCIMCYRDHLCSKCKKFPSTVAKKGTRLLCPACCLQCSACD